MACESWLRVFLVACVLVSIIFIAGCLNQEQINQIKELVSKASQTINATTKSQISQPLNETLPTPPSQPPTQPPIQPPVQPPREPTQTELIQTLNETFMFPE